MVLPSNDAFVGLDAMPIPGVPGIYTYLLNAHDAGTEANDEIVNGGGGLGEPGIPADPGGHEGEDATETLKQHFDDGPGLSLATLTFQPGTWMASNFVLV